MFGDFDRTRRDSAKVSAMLFDFGPDSTNSRRFRPTSARLGQLWGTIRANFSADSAKLGRLRPNTGPALDNFGPDLRNLGPHSALGAFGRLRCLSNSEWCLRNLVGFSPTSAQLRLHLGDVCRSCPDFVQLPFGVDQLWAMSAEVSPNWAHCRGDGHVELGPLHRCRRPHVSALSPFSGHQQGSGKIGPEARREDRPRSGPHRPFRVQFRAEFPATPSFWSFPDRSGVPEIHLSCHS